MSKENVKKFYDALAQDAALAEELDVRIAKVTFEFAAEKGFEFTAEDLVTEQTELSDKELDQVNGGGMWGLIKRMKKAIHRCIEEDKN